MALAFPFFNIDRLAIVIPTRSASSVTLIFRLASMTSTFTIIAKAFTSDRQIIFCFYLDCAGQEPLQHCREDSNNGRGEGNDQT